jgi:hypothetical protein
MFLVSSFLEVRKVVDEKGEELEDVTVHVLFGL